MLTALSLRASGILTLPKARCSPPPRLCLQLWPVLVPMAGMHMSQLRARGIPLVALSLTYPAKQATAYASSLRCLLHAPEPCPATVSISSALSQIPATAQVGPPTATQDGGALQVFQTGVCLLQVSEMSCRICESSFTPGCLRLRFSAGCMPFFEVKSWKL